MAIYYKFKSAKDYELLPLEGHFISIQELKTKIFESKYLSKPGTDIDIVISNAETGQEYVNNTDWVPRQTSVVVRRVAGNPRLRKKAKIQLRENDVIKIDQETKTDGKYIDGSQIQQEEEEERKKEEEDFGGDVYADQSQKLNEAASYHHHHQGRMTTNTNKARADTILLQRELSHSSKFLHDSPRVRGVEEVNAVDAPRVSRPGLQIPPELYCPICKKIMKDAVLMGKCCFNSYCCECITKHLNSNMWTCLCGQANISIERDLVLNKTLRDTIHRFAQMTPIDSSVSNVTSINGNARLSAPGRRPGFQVIKGKNSLPRPGYVCYRCNIPGHFIHNCPTVNGDHFFALQNFKRPIAELY